ncbi:family 16 glycoside hydrolase [uncultured Paludibaculum sp.]|uniref:family 16 glycoside hydrolase n=1 Tax=uncultured Paludibaculum sp. TaxID=1765020 RepID=UPI002AABAC60|nr:family 16 glycoside hydrolase [uncultured Paludibaculum sp.]
MRSIRIPCVAMIVLILLACAAMAQPAFYLTSGDRVVFYGDSITDQRLYTTFVETFVRTRFPQLNVSFVHSGWGGDRVTGGGGGPVGVRLRRDVAVYKPTVVTIMLGMNDGRYRPFDQTVFDWYRTGYESMVKDLKSLVPEARITLIRPSPYDEVTRQAMDGGGYNPVLVKFGDLLQEMAAKQGMQVADLNGPVVKMLEQAKATNADLAARIIPDRVHPGPAGHLIMAASLLESWGAPGLVSDVELDASNAKVTTSSNTAVTGLAASNGLSWTQTDKSLPIPVDLNDATMALAVKSGGFLEKMDRETLKVNGLKPGHYALRIDGLQVAVFTDEQLKAGLNLAAWPTPMMKQASEVHALTMKRSGIHNTRWRTIEVPLEADHLAGAKAAMDALDVLDAELDAKQRAAAVPLARKYELVPVTEVEAHVPPGFTPIFNGKDTTGWHISRTNHHGTTPDWRVENGVLVGMQNPKGKGGILLTDKKYKNFEVYLELNPDWGCDGGLFLRSSERGEAYQVMIDYREGGTLGGVYGERLKDVVGSSVNDWEKNYKRNEWNSIRARIDGDIPRIQVWMNGVRVTEWSDVANHAVDGAAEGMIAVQVHGGTQIWKEGGKQMFRNIAVRELP